MPNDAKLGMIVGVGLVIAIAVLFFRKDGASNPVAPQRASATAVHPVVPPKNSPSTSPPRGLGRHVKARTAIRKEEVPVEGQKHTVREGETLFSLARRYYQDEKKFVDIYRVNREVVKDPDALAPGTVLLIPRLP